MEEEQRVATWEEDQMAQGRRKTKIPWLQDWRLCRKLTVTKLSRVSGVSATTIHKLELNTTMAEPATIRKLLKALDLPSAVCLIEQCDRVVAEATRRRTELYKRPVENLRQRRTVRGWSQAELAVQAGVAVNTVRAAEAGFRVSGDVGAKLNGVLPEVPKKRVMA